MKMFGIILAIAIGTPLAGSSAAAPATKPHLIEGTFDMDRGPDGNSVFIDAPDGLILVDTGRQIAHRDKLLAYARERGRPIVALVNTHWHLDHATGNGDLKRAFPAAAVYASEAVDGALKVFLAPSRERMQQRLASGELPADRQPQARRSLEAVSEPSPLRPTRPVTRSGNVIIGGRPLRLNLATFAATEGDIWIYDQATRTAIAGDLVVADVPFMDSACPDGWRKALDEIAATPFETLIPGHGAPMTKPQFLSWRAAYNNLLDCAASTRPGADCIAGWRRDAAQFIAPEREKLIDEMTGYYLDSRLRAKPEERDRYCRPMA